jgi:hypothetical protein
VIQASSIEDLLFQTLSTDGAINIVGSPQNSALSAIKDSSPGLDPNNPNDQVEILQRFALNTLYYSTDGANWGSSDSWTSVNHPCGSKGATIEDIAGPWFGVLCDANLQYVQKITLDNNGLRGGLPSDIRGLSKLNRLEISNNQLSGSLTDAIGDLNDLSVLDIGTNFFTGTIPPAIANSRSLLMLDVSSNFLSGNLPAEITQLTSLLSLSAKSNFFGGTLATELFAITPLSKYQQGVYKMAPLMYRMIPSNAFCSLCLVTFCYDANEWNVFS